MTTKMETKIASVPDRENLVAELWYDKVMWAEIAQENNEPILELYPHPTGKPWTFKFSEALAFLQQAMHRLEMLDEPRQEGEAIE
jgi:hypothetical protein